MSQTIQFTVPAVPVPQPRARATTMNGRARMYEAKQAHPIHAFKCAVGIASRSAYQGAPLDEPLTLYAVFVLPRPKLPKKLGVDRLPHTKRGDVDNFLKGLMDALNGLLWRDDALICSVNVCKVVAAAGEQPHVEIAVSRYL